MEEWGLLFLFPILLYTIYISGALGGNRRAGYYLQSEFRPFHDCCFGQFVLAVGTGADGRYVNFGVVVDCV